MAEPAHARRPPLGLYPGRDQPRLYDVMVRIFDVKHYSRRTKKSYLYWVGRYLRFHDGKHPRELAEPDLNAFLSHLATDRNVAAATQDQALAAILFLYKHALDAPLGRVEDIVRSKKPKRLPEVLTRQAVAHILHELAGVPRLVCMLQYGSGLRIEEALSLRVKDLDFGRCEIVVRDGKGGKDRVTTFPEAVHEELKAHLRRVRLQHMRDLGRGLGRVPMPTALARKYPNADREWAWQWVFPARRHFTDRKTGVRHRWHLHESVVAKALRAAVRRVGITKRVTTHTFRHSFATHLLEDGQDIRTVQELCGHNDVRTTMIYLHVLNRGGLGVLSPLDRLGGSVTDGRTYADREGHIRRREWDRRTYEDREGRVTRRGPERERPLRPGGQGNGGPREGAGDELEPPSESIE